MNKKLLNFIRFIVLVYLFSLLYCSWDNPQHEHPPNNEEYNDDDNNEDNNEESDKYMLESTASWTSVGDNVYSIFGHALASGDINGDGYTDLVVGAYGYNSVTGKAYLYLGSQDGLSSSYSWSTSGDNQAGSQFGAFLAVANVNGDNYDDIIVTACAYSSTNQYAGKAYLYLGSASGPPATPDWTDSGDDQANAGLASIGTGDFNNDGYDDIVIGSFWFNTGNTRAGKVYLYLGEASGLSDTYQWSSVGTDIAYAHFGRSVACAGDVNNDNYDDVIIGANYSHDGVFWGNGEAFLFLGGPGGLSSSPDWTSVGDDQAEAGYGGYVSSAGDVNNDGYSDVAIVAGYYDTTGKTDVGKAYVYLGNSSGLDSSPIWTTSCENQDGQRLAIVSSPGDINNDGFSDLVLSAFLFNTPIENAGKVYLYLGNTSGLSSEYIWSSSGDNISNYRFGAPMISSDFNNDGHLDLAIGNCTNNDYNGKVFIYMNRPTN